MVKHISSNALKGIAFVTDVAVIVLSTPSSLSIGSAITLLGLGWSALGLNDCKRDNPQSSVDINNAPDDTLMFR